MPPPEYEPLPEDGDESLILPKYPPQIRPTTYYGEGEFDPPSSDDEEETFLEKKPANGQADTERGEELLDDEEELVVGGKKARRSKSHATGKLTL